MTTAPAVPKLEIATYGAVGALALAAWVAGHWVKVPALLIAAALGLGLALLPRPAAVEPLLTKASKLPLRLGVAALGAKITFADFAALGWAFALAVAGGVALLIGLGLALAPLFGLRRRDGFIAAGATAICGASAAAALGSVFPDDEKIRRAVLGAILATAALSTVAMFLYPAVAAWLQMPPQAAGGFLGASIHDVAQVAGAGFAISPQAGDTAMIVKLWRVAMLAPVVAIAALVVRAGASRAGGAKPALLPWFLLVFLALATANSLGLIPENVRAIASQASALLLLYAIAALGLATSWRELKQIGWGLFGLVLLLTVLLAGLALAAVHLLA
jgi:uncharacterized integral membrane protein (TIGR00698 family)